MRRTAAGVVMATERRTAAGVVMATEMVWPLRTPKSWTLYSGCSLNYADFNLLITTD